MSNFNLSDKINNQGACVAGHVIPAINVKEFIRLLKEYQDKKIKLGKENKFTTKREKEMHMACCIDTKMHIEELAGDKLI